MQNESLRSDVALAQSQLDALRGGVAKVWHFRPSYSLLVIRISMPDWVSRRAYLDCVACSRVSFVRYWEPANLVIKLRDDIPTAPLLVMDGDHLQVECRAVRVEEMDGGNRRDPPTCGMASWAELMDKIRPIEHGELVSERKFEKLCSFLWGYEAALRDNRIEWNDDRLSRLDFQKWLDKRLDCERMHLACFGAVRFRSNDDEEAYHRFFELWQEYRLEKNLDVLANTGRPQGPPPADRPSTDGSA